MERLGKYVLLERLNAGGMAEVWRGKLIGAAGIHKDVAIKRILPEHAKNQAFIQMFLDEARLCVELTHGNIVPTYELGEHKGSYFLAMEYLSGKNLGELLDACVVKGRRAPPQLAAYVAREVCAGLDYAHRKADAQGRPLGIVHRDISPQNVMLSWDGEVKILDFGIAKARSHLNVTQAGVIKGKHGYLAPEQAAGAPFDYKVDLFAAGILLYESLTLQRAFYGETDIETLEAVKRCEVRSPRELAPSVPPELEAACLKALQKDPARRFPSAGAMADALTRAGAGEAGGARALQRLLLELFPEDRQAEKEKQRSYAEQLKGERPTSSPNVIARRAASQPRVIVIEPEERPERRGAGLWILVAVAAVCASLFLARDRIPPLARALATLQSGPEQKRLGTLVVTTTPPGARVYFDGKLQAESPLRIGNVDPDKAYELVLTHDGFAPVSRKVTPKDWVHGPGPLELTIDQRFKAR